MALFRVDPERPEFPALTLANTDEVMELGDRLAGVKLVVLNFPKFTDGRAYSQARLLRERLGYIGELRATGVVLRDQLPFLLRCGFDAFESDQPGFGEALAAARTLFSVVYQPVGDGRITAGELRLRQMRDPVSLVADWTPGIRFPADLPASAGLPVRRGRRGQAGPTACRD